MLLAGLDIGTTGCKIVVYTAEGEFLGRVYRDYPVQRKSSGHEIDPANMWDAVQTVIREATEKYPGIGGMGVASLGESFVMMDEDDTPLFPCMIYTDPRGKEQCAELTEKLGAERITEITGLAPASMYSMPKMMWIKEHHPELWARVRRICLVEDYVVYKLTGVRQIDYTIASRTMAFDINKLTWSREIFDAAGIDVELMSKPVRMGTVAGEVTDEYCKKLGFAPGTKIVSISIDQMAAAVGSGIFNEDCAVDGAGTVECVGPVFEKCDVKKMAESKLPILPYAIPGKYFCLSFLFTGGALTQWYIRTLAGYAKAQADEEGVNVHEVLERRDHDGPTGLLVLPHFAGAATPYMDAESRGAIIGLTVEHTQQDIYLACLEGVCYEMRLNIDRLRGAGIDVKALRATGGGARSKTWMQMKADILNVPVTALRSEEAGGAGSAMLVGVACGVFRDLDEAASVMTETMETYYPRADIHEKYNAVYEKYLKLYDAVRPLV